MQPPRVELEENTVFLPSHEASMDVSYIHIADKQPQGKELPRERNEAQRSRKGIPGLWQHPEGTDK